MRKIFIVFIFITGACFLKSQLQMDSLSVTDNSTCSAYVSPGFQVSVLNNESANIVGLNVGIILNDKYIVAFKLSGIAKDPKVNNLLIDSVNPNLKVRYEGLQLGMYYFKSDYYRLSGGFLIGVGSAYYYYKYYYKGEEMESLCYFKDSFLVVEPYLGINVNTGKDWFRAEINVSYRIVGGAKFPATTNSDLSGPSIGLSILLGTF
jgi:hypothetical protein